MTTPVAIKPRVTTPGQAPFRSGTPKIGPCCAKKTNLVMILPRGNDHFVTRRKIIVFQESDYRKGDKGVRTRYTWWKPWTVFCIKGGREGLQRQTTAWSALSPPISSETGRKHPRIRTFPGRRSVWPCYSGLHHPFNPCYI